jgi:competence protein ComGC
MWWQREKISSLLLLVIEPHLSQGEGSEEVHSKHEAAMVSMTLQQLIVYRSLWILIL